ncbi:hypothetical protein HO173_012609 [Letharia columbiana]|uniref:Uncharacterized protein n=1 Tax=Letharia columbiana TaxID=112416 RepID=A0A8H6CM36_9LECA|nr:uncharacterized protein HO173_012609 [Letharia columbiana]KAF6226019.1 hypothetical protein HO173_012609 [Letharia columbiana]
MLETAPDQKDVRTCTDLGSLAYKRSVVGVTTLSYDGSGSAAISTAHSDPYVLRRQMYDKKRED